MDGQGEELPREGVGEVEEKKDPDGGEVTVPVSEGKEVLEEKGEEVSWMGVSV